MDYIWITSNISFWTENIHLFLVWLRKDKNFFIRRHRYVMHSIQLLLAHKLLAGLGGRLKLLVKWDFFLHVEGLILHFDVEQQLKFVPLRLCCYIYMFSVYGLIMCHVSILFWFWTQKTYNAKTEIERIMQNITIHTSMSFKSFWLMLPEKRKIQKAP